MEISPVALGIAPVAGLRGLSKAGDDADGHMGVGLGKVKPTYTADGLIWICNEATKKDLLIRSLEYNSSAAIMAGFDNTMPIIGGEFITLEFMPAPE